MMRLTCPNCGARYEVDDSLVPPEGRDVQCSNCATTWFQPGRRSERRPTAVHVQRPVPEPSPTAPPPPSAPPRRDLDPTMRDILREEAAREARLRRGQALPVETQAEMPLEETDTTLERAVRDRVAAAQGRPPPSEPMARRDLLPDIEELNSTLRDTGDRSAQDDSTTDIDALEYAPQRRRGVRLGFLLVLALAATAAALYANAGTLVALVPALEGPLVAYVSGVDALRIWLDAFVQRLAGDAG